jgi:hypothetical protein
LDRTCHRPIAKLTVLAEDAALYLLAIALPSNWVARRARDQVAEGTGFLGCPCHRMLDRAGVKSGRGDARVGA